MNDEQIAKIKQALQDGKKVIWLGGNDAGMLITRVVSRKDELGAECGYLRGGKPGSYIVLWNADPKEIYIGECLV